MSSDVITAEGVVVASGRGDMHTVDAVVAGQTLRVLAKRSGRLNDRFIRVIAGDRVVVEVSPYDLKRGRIVQRLDGVRSAQSR